MTPTGVAVLLLLGLAIDYISIGPNWLRDRIAFLMYIASVYEGFNGSQLDAWTLETLTGFIRGTLNTAGDAYIASTPAKTAGALVGILVGAVWLYGVAMMLPAKASKRFGRFATVSFPPSGVWAINTKLLLTAIALGLLGDVPLGWVGYVTHSTNMTLAGFFAPLPDLLLGGA